MTTDEQRPALDRTERLHRHDSPSSGSVPFEHLFFLGQFVRNPARVGAILPSSARLARSMIEGTETTPGMRVAELGAGTGRITAEIARWLPEDGVALAIDVEPAFVERLAGRWSQVECVCEQAEHLADMVRERGFEAFDHIVSGLPFAALPAQTTQRILYAVQRSLREGGTFTTFQYLHAWLFPSAANFRRAASRRLGSEPLLKFVGANVPPAMVLRWRKTTQTSDAGRNAGRAEIARPH